MKRKEQSPKLSQAELEAKLAEWAIHQRKIEKIEEQRDAELEPIQARFERAAAPIVDLANRKIQPLQEKLDELGEEIKKSLLAGVRADGTVELAQVTTAKAIAAVNTTPGKRVIDPRTFFQKTPAAKRTDAFWGCFSVLIKQAEKFLGDGIDKLAKKDPTHSVSISLK